MNRMLYVLLLVVALAAAVLSFDALHGLAILCGFTPKLAPLLPITVDAGAAAGSFVWLRGEAPAQARWFARVLALVLLSGSVAGNALGHGLSAYAARPAWWVVVLVSAVPPAVLGAVVHLAVLTGRGEQFCSPDEDARDLEDVEPPIERDWWETAPPAGEPAGDRAGQLIAEGVGRRRLARELGIKEHEARQLLTRYRVNGHATVGEAS